MLVLLNVLFLNYLKVKYFDDCIIMNDSNNDIARREGVFIKHRDDNI